MRALILASFSNHYIARLRQSIQVTHEDWMEKRRLYDPEELAVRLNKDNVSILIVESDFVFEETFEQADRLRFVGICRAATNHIDVDSATERGVCVVNTPGRNAQAVAEHTLGLMLALARNTLAAHSYVREMRWQNPLEPYISFRGIELAGRTLGVIGMGAIGRKLSKLGNALGMKVVGYDPYASDVPDYIELTSLEALLGQSDFVSVHVPLNSETEALLDARRLASMKPTAYLISASDTSVFEIEAMIGALKQKRIAGAAFDVFETHPISPQNPLLSLENVILTPHIGGATGETIERHSRMMTEDVLRFLRDERPLNLVNPEVWEHRG